MFQELQVFPFLDLSSNFFLSDLIQMRVMGAKGVKQRRDQCDGESRDFVSRWLRLWRINLGTHAGTQSDTQLVHWSTGCCIWFVPKKKKILVLSFGFVMLNILNKLMSLKKNLFLSWKLHFYS